MNQKDIEFLTSLLNETRDVYQSISRRIHWSASDSEYLDDLMNSRNLQEDIGNRIFKLTKSRDLTQLVPQFILYKAWQRTKAVYSFTGELVEDVARTADTNLRISLLEQLPFRDMLFFFPEGLFPKPKDEETAGIFIHIESHPEHLWASFNYFDRKLDDGKKVYPGIVIAFPIADGMKISQVFQTPQYLDWLDTYKRTMAFDHSLTEQEAEERLLAEKKALNASVNLLYYLAAENADIKPIKRHKKARKPSSSSNDDNIPAIKLHEVGSEYAEIVFRKFKETKAASASKEVSENETDGEENSGDTTELTEKIRKKMRPHVRRAHWQHYWTGEGRSIPILRWKSDLFVGINREDQAVVVYEVPEESLKGKRNPNTSKKKRSK